MRLGRPPSGLIERVGLFNKSKYDPVELLCNPKRQDFRKTMSHLERLWLTEPLVRTVVPMLRSEEEMVVHLVVLVRKQKENVRKKPQGSQGER